MALTKTFQSIVKNRIANDSVFKQALFQEAMQCLIEGDIVTGRAILRDYINATIGFEQLAIYTEKPSKSLMRMFGATGNPRADSLLNVIKTLQDKTGVALKVQAQII